MNAKITKIAKGSKITTADGKIYRVVESTKGGWVQARRSNDLSGPIQWVEVSKVVRVG